MWNSVYNVQRSERNLNQKCRILEHCLFFLFRECTVPEQIMQCKPEDHMAP